MTATTRIAAGVASGYLLGRSKKLKLAITVGSMLAGSKLAAGSGGLREQGSKVLGNKDVMALRDQITGRLADAAKTAALNTATSRMESWTSRLGGPLSDTADDAEDEVDETGEDLGDEAEDTADEAEETADEAEDTADETEDTGREVEDTGRETGRRDRKSTRLNSSHMSISYAVFCLK